MVQVGVESENGWRPPDLRPNDARLAWLKVPGADVTLQLQTGRPATIMLAVAADFNAFIEKLRDADSAAYTDGNSVFTSNHKNATGMDLNWNGHAFQVRGTFTAAQMVVIRQMLDFYEGWIFWAGDWDDPVDEMHWQMGYGTWSRSDADFQDFCRRKIRADGFSTFRRGGADSSVEPVHETVELDAVAVLVQAAGITAAKAQQILPALSAGLRLAQATTVNRIAMDIAQWGHESDNFNATEEYQNGDESTERWKYKGRTWIQITWLGKASPPPSGYAGFSQWAFDQGLVPNPTYFVDRPRELADVKWAGIGAAWYTVVARPDINALADAGDIETVSRRINGTNPDTGRANGIDDRVRRWQRALALGDQLLQLIDTEDGDDMFTDADRDLLRQIAEYRRPSRSPLRHVGEGNVDTCAGFAWAADGNVHALLISHQAVVFGDPAAIALLYEVASADLTTYPDRAEDAKLAKRILDKVAPADLALANAAIAAWLSAEKAAAAPAPKKAKATS